MNNARERRETLNPQQPYAFFVEDECSTTVATLFLTNRECPWRCVMCDLWRNTLMESVPVGAIPAQIDYALSRLSPARAIKLYNSGSFFDPRAIPVEDYEAIAARLQGFERVIVECHPALIGESCWRFRDLLKGRLEVAMGLETVHPDVLPRLNKRMTLEQFSAAAETLRRNDIDLRAFILVQPPFMQANEALYWAERSLDFAFRCEAAVATLIPTRANYGQFSPPQLETLEAAQAYGLNLRRGRVFADTWDIDKFVTCQHCGEARVFRLREMNLCQSVSSSVPCDFCGGSR